MILPMKKGKHREVKQTSQGIKGQNQYVNRDLPHAKAPAYSVGFSLPQVHRTLLVNIKSYFHSQVTLNPIHHITVYSVQLMSYSESDTGTWNVSTRPCDGIAFYWGLGGELRLPDSHPRVLFWIPFSQILPEFTLQLASKTHRRQLYPWSSKQTVQMQLNVKWNGVNSESYRGNLEHTLFQRFLFLFTIVERNLFLPCLTVPHRGTPIRIMCLHQK